MIEKMEKIIQKIKGQSNLNKTTIASEAKNPVSSQMKTFAGVSKEQVDKQIANSETRVSSNLKTSVVGEDARNSLKQYSSKDKVTPANNISVDSQATPATIISSLFCEGSYAEATEKLKEYINANKGKVDKSYWYMLLDIYQITNDKTSFEKIALAFAAMFNSSPPSWVPNPEEEEVKTLVSGKNIMILESTLKLEHTAKFKDFLKASKEENFCRINISQCKFENADFSALLQLHKLFIDLRKANVMAVLMGESNLINFCKNYINPGSHTSILRDDFVNNENLLWLLYLEVLQWKGKNEEFENLAHEYAMKFEISPPGWEEKGVMKFVQPTDSGDNPNFPLIDKVISYNNVKTIFSIIEHDFQTSTKSEVDLSHVERIDFASCGEIAQYVQTVLESPANRSKQIIFKYPNEMILNILELVGVTQFITVIEKVR